MSSEDRIVFTKDNINTYLKALAKEYRRLGGKKLPAELVLIGGASVLINYGFREMTTDVDAVIQSASTMKETKEALIEFEDKFPGRTNNKNVADIVSMLKKERTKDENKG